MELCCGPAATPSGLSVPTPNRPRPRHPAASLLPSAAQAYFRTRRSPSQSFSKPGARYFGLRVLTTAALEDATSRPSISTKEDTVPLRGVDGAKPFARKEDAPLQPPSAGTKETYGSPAAEKVGAFKEENGSGETPSVIEYEEVARENDQNEALQFLSNLDLKLDSEDAYSILLYGSGAFVALWVSSAVVGALDSIPLIPKMLEVIGLGYAVWFAYRYLIFKKNRDELFEKFEDLKEQILGPSD